MDECLGPRDGVFDKVGEAAVAVLWWATLSARLNGEAPQPDSEDAKAILKNQ